MEQFSNTSHVQPEESEFSNIGAMCEFDQNEDTFSVYFGELEYHFTENGQKQHTCGISNAREISRLCFKNLSDAWRRKRTTTTGTAILLIFTNAS